MNWSLLNALMTTAVAVPGLVYAGGCATPLASDDLHRRGRWAELEGFVASPGLNAAIRTVQTIAQYGVGDINNDFYAITIDAQGDTQQSMAAFLRANFSQLVFAGTTYAFRPYDAVNAQMWSSSQPQGTLGTFVLAYAPNPVVPLAGPIEIRGSVVMSCDAGSNWVFSTVETANDGWHPVSGNRSFGVSTNQDGSLRIWTKAADRAVNSGALGIVHAHSAGAREQTFQGGHQVWIRLLNNLSERLRNRNPRDRVEFSVRRPYPAP